MSSPSPVFVALYPPHLRGLVEDAVRTFVESWLLLPGEGEVFKSGKACLGRLQTEWLGGTILDHHTATAPDPRVA